MPPDRVDPLDFAKALGLYVEKAPGTRCCLDGRCPLCLARAASDARATSLPLHLTTTNTEAT